MISHAGWVPTRSNSIRFKYANNHTSLSTQMMWPFSTTQYPALSVDQVGIPFDTTDTQAQVKNATYDYIVVGGGTAGCCLASRLSENPAVSVLVLERGGVNDAWFSRIPLISGDVTSKSTPIVRASSAPLSCADGQIVDIVHAETLGGGSSVNAMLVTRGAVGDSNHWAELGHPSWDYASLKPYFIKSEKSLSQHSDGHGHSGPWVNQNFPQLPFEVQRQVKDAALALGFPDVHDFNGSDVPVNVCATMDAAIDSKMRRVSTYHAFLPSEIARKRRSHLKVCTRAVATRVEFDAGVAVGNQLRLSPEHRSAIHHFLTFFKSLPPDVLLAMAYQQATMLQSLELIQATRADYDSMKEVMAEVKQALAQNVDLTKEQTLEVNAVCKFVVWDPVRTDFDNDDIRKAAMKHLEKYQATNGLKSFLDANGQARTKALSQAVGRGASYAKSTYRALLSESLDQKTGTCLTATVSNAMRKLMGSTENTSPRHAIQVVILRQFGRENAILLVKKKSKKRAHEDSAQTATPHIPDSDSDAKWWSAVTEFFDKKAKQWGTDRKSPGWTSSPASMPLVFGEMPAS
ncbi:GMC oxidoreductase-domain-containing protein [Mycena sp. CBHHK59/15]|nr:GMC oxidoreductase-domain-containing protein [Mycena sp. CBHHK59/15]